MTGNTIAVLRRLGNVANDNDPRQIIANIHKFWSEVFKQETVK